MINTSYNFFNGLRFHTEYVLIWHNCKATLPLTFKNLDGLVTYFIDFTIFIFSSQLTVRYIATLEKIVDDTTVGTSHASV